MSDKNNALRQIHEQPPVRLLYAEIMKNREKLLKAFIAETGLKPSEIEMVQINDYDKIRWYVQKREVEP